MHHDREELSLLQPLQKREIHVARMLLEHVIEIAHRLMEVDTENEMERVQLGALREAEPPRHVTGSLRS